MSERSQGQATLTSTRSEDHDFPNGPGGSGKKRKVPGPLQAKRAAAYSHPSHPPEDDREDDGDPHSQSQSQSRGGEPSRKFPITRRLPRSPARLYSDFRKSVFLRRKAAFITLYIDAQNVINSTLHLSSSAQHKKRSTFPDVSDFEKLLPALEDVAVNAWPPDRPGWRSDRAGPVKWRRRRRERGVHRQPIERKGWMPEGSFEFEMECKASKTLRARAREQSALLNLAQELRSLILTSDKSTNVVKSTTTAPAPAAAAEAGTEDKSPSKARRELDRAKKVSTDGTVAVNLDTEPVPESHPMSQAPSKDSTEASKGKKKSKKKKRSVLANQSNPHHVDNYRPSRTVSPHSDPYEPYSYHLALFSPPSMPFLAARRRSKGNPDEPMVVRPGEDEFICSFCEFDLYYGSDKARRNAIRRRKKEMKRKEAIKAKARNVAEGRGKLNDDEDDYETDEDDEDEDEDEDGDGQGCDDDGHGRCTCGRRVRKPRPKPDKNEGQAHIEEITDA